MIGGTDSWFLVTLVKEMAASLSFIYATLHNYGYSFDRICQELPCLPRIS